MLERPSIAVIVNGGAGAIKADPRVGARLQELFGAAGSDVAIVAPPSPRGLAEAAREASRRASIVVAAGGDGTVSSVAAALVDSPAALGVLPMGSRNHFAKDLHIPLALDDAVATIVTGQIGRVDVGQVNDRIFINNASIGVYPGMIEAREELRQQGHFKWTAMAIATWRVLRSYPGMTVTIDAERHVRTRRTPLVVVGNNEYAVHGLAVGRRERLDEGKLFAYLTPRTRTRDLPMLVAKALAGRAGDSGTFEIVQAAELTITARGVRMRVAIDGEIAMMSLPLRYRVCAGALQVMLPRR